MKYKAKKAECADCKSEPRRKGQSKCKSCHAAYMRQWRSERVYVKKPISGEALEDAA